MLTVNAGARNWRPSCGKMDQSLPVHTHTFRFKYQVIYTYTLHLTFNLNVKTFKNCIVILTGVHQFRGYIAFLL